MGSYRNVQLPEDIERGATGGPRFKTTVQPSFSGHEKRNVDWSRIRGEYDIGYGIQNEDDFLRVRDFFYAVAEGQAYSFAFRDWADYQIPDFKDAPSAPPPAQIAVSDGLETTYQVYKPYVYGAYSYLRKIEKVIDGTFELYYNSVLQLETAWDLDVDTGVFTLQAGAPTAGTVIGIKCDYFVPVRFASDELNMTLEQIQIGTYPNITLIEVRDEVI